MWKNKQVWITGASSGIGKAISEALAAKGARLILSSRSAEKLENIRASLPNAEAHTVLPIDVSNRDQIQQIGEAHRELLSNTDVLINNAGISQRAQAWEANEESERQVMETNYFGAILLTKLVLPGMMERNSGKIVVLSSIVGHIGFAQRSSYAASKHALHGYFNSMRVDLMDRSIDITIVCPGRIRTNISYNAVTAGGEAHGELDPGQAKGIPAEECARRIIKATEQGKAEIYIGKEQILIYLKRIWPGLLRKLVKRVKPN